ncbi:hypothetical protein A0H81_10122 [Grifola frondosa]|uniref:Uncharacterized protein n=1 Tax=Grifola frondosa TaxID=5627 RepID=A0A1C7LZK2_GRIFR|nr:hypothetical protein A0H81_10122 [Grifola frondosa]
MSGTIGTSTVSPSSAKLKGKKGKKDSEDRVYTDALLTIKPEFADLISKREKNYEYRKYQLRPTVERLWLYETAPTSALTYVITTDLPKTPGEVNDSTGVGNDDFDKGLKESKFGYPVKGLHRLKEPVTMADMETQFGIRAPQGFCFATKNSWIGYITSYASMACTLPKDGRNTDLRFSTSMHLGTANTIASEETELCIVHAFYYCILQSLLRLDMHRCLLITEILLEIIEQAYGNYDPTFSSVSSVASLARTCHTFLEPSLDRLWRVQASNVPLVKTLPADAWQENEVGVILGELVLCLTRELRREDFARFNTYAARIRAFDVRADVARNCQPRSNVLDSDTCRYLARWSDTLTSQLHVYSLHWRLPRRGGVEFARLFLGPSLKKLRLDFLSQDENEAQLNAFFTQMRQSCRALIHLSVSFYDVDCPATLPSAISTLLLESAILRTVCLNVPLSDDDIVHLASIPTLTEAQFRLNSNCSLFGVPLRSPFPALRCLTLHISSINVCGTLLQAMNFCQLQELHLTCEHLASGRLLGQFLSVLHGCCSHSSLTTFELEISDPDVDPIQFEDASILTPLLAFSGMRVVSFDANFTFLFDNTSLREVSSHWPLLEAFDFLSPLDKRPEATFAGLYRFVNSCPKLTSFALAINTAHEDLDDSDMTISRSQINVIHLSGSTTDGDPLIVAKSLLRICPKLQHIYTREWGIVYWDDVEANNVVVLTSGLGESQILDISINVR